MLNTSFWLDTRRQTLTGENKGRYHIKLCIDFPVVKAGKKSRNQRRYKTELYCDREDYVSMWSEIKKTKRSDLIALKRKLFDIKANADGIIDKYRIQDQKTFELFFLSEHDLELVSGQFEIMIKKKLAIKPRPKVSTAEKYRTALKSLIEFSHPQLTFQEITVDFLREYQEWYLQPREKISTSQKRKGKILIKKPGNITSVGYNCRHLRAVFNQAIKLNAISPECYPFGIDRYIIPEGGKEVKEFLNAEQKNKFINYKPTDKETEYYFDFAIFDYYANGINFTDIINLKRNQVFEDYILIERQKTEGRHRKTRRIVIPIHPRMQAVIKKHGAKTLDPNGYVFPILNSQMTFTEAEKAKNRFVRKTNEALESIRIYLELPVKITTYTIRHTFSAMMLEMGASTEHLQDSLGHGSKQTTESYKHGFSLAIKKKFSEGL